MPGVEDSGETNACWNQQQQLPPLCTKPHFSEGRLRVQRWGPCSLGAGVGGAGGRGAKAGGVGTTKACCDPQQQCLALPGKLTGVKLRTLPQSGQCMGMRQGTGEGGVPRSRME